MDEGAGEGTQRAASGHIGYWDRRCGLVDDWRGGSVGCCCCPGAGVLITVGTNGNLRCCMSSCAAAGRFFQYVVSMVNKPEQLLVIRNEKPFIDPLLK